MPLNVLHIVVDQHHASWLGCAGHPHCLTPHIDQLAKEGQRWTNHHAPAILSTPSRISLLSGQYCLNHGYYGINGQAPDHLPSLFSHFKQAGYRTAGIGKLHLPNDPKVWSAEHLDLLADTKDGFHFGEPSAYGLYLEKHGVAELDDHRGMKELAGEQRQWEGRPSTIPLEHCVEAWISKQALAFLDTVDDQPFYAHLSYPRPHHCLTPDQKFWDMIPEDVPLPETFGSDLSGRPAHFQERAAEHARDIQWSSEPKTYQAGAQRAWRATLALVAQNDHFIGQVIEGLKERGLYDNTIILFHADHGAYHGEYGILEKAPGINSDAICRVPMVWRVPGFERTGPCAAPASHVDIGPTLAELTETGTIPTADGISLQSIMQQSESVATDRPIVTECPMTKSILQGPWRLVHTHRKMHDGRDVGELYNMEQDPHEYHNLYHDPEHQGIVIELRRRLLEWMTETRRIATGWPPVKDDQGNWEPRQPLQPDGYEAAGGLDARIRQGVTNTFDPRDYL